jgi:hypothetical protein
VCVEVQVHFVDHLTESEEGPSALVHQSARSLSELLASSRKRRGRAMTKTIERHDIKMVAAWKGDTLKQVSPPVTFNHGVEGSSPSAITRKSLSRSCFLKRLKNRRPTNPLRDDYGTI